MTQLPKKVKNRLLAGNILSMWNVR